MPLSSKKPNCPIAESPQNSDATAATVLYPAILICIQAFSIGHLLRRKAQLQAQAPDTYINGISGLEEDIRGAIRQACRCRRESPRSNRCRYIQNEDVLRPSRRPRELASSRSVPCRLRGTLRLLWPSMRSLLAPLRFLARREYVSAYALLPIAAHTVICS